MLSAKPSTIKYHPKEELKEAPLVLTNRPIVTSSSMRVVRPDLSIVRSDVKFKVILILSSKYIKRW